MCLVGRDFLTGQDEECGALYTPDSFVGIVVYWFINYCSNCNLLIDVLYISSPNNLI